MVLAHPEPSIPRQLHCSKEGLFVCLFWWLLNECSAEIKVCLCLRTLPTPATVCPLQAHLCPLLPLTAGGDQRLASMTCSYWRVLAHVVPPSHGNLPHPRPFHFCCFLTWVDRALQNPRSPRGDLPSLTMSSSHTSCRSFTSLLRAHTLAVC